MAETFVHSHLIVGGNRNEREEEAKKIAEVKDLSPKPDFFLIQRGEEKSIGIDEVRRLRKHLALKTHEKKIKKVVILEAQDLTREAQNALLKTLEEPPARSLIILTAPHPSLLLPTITSRCQIKKLERKNEIDLQSDGYRKIKEEFLKLISGSRGERIVWTEKNKKWLSDRDEAKKILSFWLAALREKLLKRGKKGSPSVALRRQSFEASVTLAKEGPPSVALAKEGLHLFRLLSTTNISPDLTLAYFLLRL